MKTKRKSIIYYFICISVGATAFQVYGEGLKNLHWAYAGFLFSFISWLSMVLLHNPTVKLLQKSARFEKEISRDEKRWLELTKNEFISILFVGLLSFGNFVLMLPFLKNQETAIYYTIIGSALVRIVAIDVAQKLFNDKIGNKFLFWLGFIICIIGIFLFKYKDFINSSINYTVIMCSLVWGCIGVIIDQVKRYITINFSKRKRRIPYLSETFLNIKTLQEKSELIKTFLFFITAIIFFYLNQFSFSFPKIKEIGCLIWIGYVVTVFGSAISLELKNKIGETISSIIQSLRVISSMAYAPIIVYFLTDNNPISIWLDGWRLFGVVIISIGSFIGLVYGKPEREEFFETPSLL